MEESFRIQWPEQVEFILNSCSVRLRKKTLRGPGAAYLRAWSGIRMKVSYQMQYKYL